MLKVPNHLVNSHWLYKNRAASNLIILDATIPKITAENETILQKKEQILGALFLTLKTSFPIEKLHCQTLSYLPKNIKKEHRK